MLDFAISVSSIGHDFTPELCEALAKNSINFVEAHPLALEEDRLAGGTQYERLREMSSAGKLAVTSLHLPYGHTWDVSKLDENARECAVQKHCELIEKYGDLGAKFLTLHASFEPVRDHDRKQRIKQVHKSLNKMVPIAKSKKMAIALEFLPRSCLGNNEEDLLSMAEPFDAASVGVCLDVNHVMSRASKLPAIIERLAPRLLSAHISDYDGIDECHWLPGFGVIDWHAVYNAFRLTGKPITLIYEIASKRGSPSDQLKLLKALENNHNQILGNIHDMA